MLFASLPETSQENFQRIQPSALRALGVASYCLIVQDVKTRQPRDAAAMNFFGCLKSFLAEGRVAVCLFAHGVVRELSIELEQSQLSSVLPA